MSASTLQFRIAEIDARRPSPGAIIECLRFDDEKRHGKSSSLLAVAEIHSTVYVYERLLDTVHAAINQARTLVTKIDGDPMMRFEKIVQKVNESLAHFASGEATPVQWSRVNLFIFQLAEEHLCFSGIGHLTNAFLQYQPDGSSKAFDLLSSLEQADPPDPRKPLSSIVCGSLNIGDVLFVGTQNLQELREKIGLVRLCQAHPPVTAALEIQQALNGLRSLDSYFGVVMAGVALTALKTTKPVPTLVPEAVHAAEPVAPPLHAIHETEQDTEKMLEVGSPQPVARLQELLGQVKTRVQTSLATMKEKTAVPVAASSGSESLSPLSLAGLRGMNAGYARGLFAEKRSAFIVGAVVLVILLGGGLWLRSVRHQQAEQRLWMAVYDEAVKSKNLAEAALVYADEDRARGQFNQAWTQLQQLDQKTPDRVQARGTLEHELTEIRSRLRKEQVLENPIVIADWRQGGASFAGQDLVLQNNKLYGLNKEQNLVHVLDLTSNASSTLLAPEGIILDLLGNGREAPLLMGTNQTLFTIRNNTLSALNATAIRQASSTVAITAYGQRAYLVDKLKGMIWRYTLSSTGLTGENAYLSEASSALQNATSLAIDSSVYVGEQAGQIEKFTSGKKDAWALTPIDPPLQSVRHLWTNAESSVIVVADPTGKRIVIFNKSGKLVQQIVSPQFQAPAAVWGDVATNSLYILDEGRVIKTTLPLPRS